MRHPLGKEARHGFVPPTSQANVRGGRRPPHPRRDKGSLEYDRTPTSFFITEERTGMQKDAMVRLVHDAKVSSAPVEIPPRCKKTQWYDSFMMPVIGSRVHSIERDMAYVDIRLRLTLVAAVPASCVYEDWCQAVPLCACSEHAHGSAGQASAGGSAVASHAAGVASGCVESRATIPLPPAQQVVPIRIV